MPRLAEFLVCDNSSEADPDAGERLEPMLLLHLTSGRMVSLIDLQSIPDWADPILVLALEIAGRAADP